jgi:fumarate reductase subunit C
MKGKEYSRPEPANWWLRKRSYRLFMLRELTAVFVAGYALFLLALLYQASQGQEAFSGFVQGLKSPVSIVLHLIALAMALYHTVTWFNLTPKAMVVWRGEQQVSPLLIAGVNYVVWVVVSGLVVWLALSVGRG